MPRMCCGGADGTLPFTISASSVGSGFFREEPRREDHRGRCPIARIAISECAVPRIDLLKFDVEGAEDLLFQDPAILECIDAFVGEIHPDLMTEPVEKFLENSRRLRPSDTSWLAVDFWFRGIRDTMTDFDR